MGGWSTSLSAGLISFPVEPVGIFAGQTYYNSTTNTAYIFDGTSWVDISVGGAVSIPNQDTYFLNQYFDKGAIPSGWTQSTSGGTVSYTQAYETGAIGQVLLTAVGALATRASVRYANGFNYILAMNGCRSTTWNFYVRRPATDNGFCLVGLSNTGTSSPTGFGNTIALINDPLNQSGMNPTLITNWLVCVRLQAGTFTIYDTGVAPTGSWQFVEFYYDNTVPLSRFLTVKINDVLVTTVLGSDTNLFVSTAPAANVALSPTIYCGKIAGVVIGNTLRVAFFNLLRKWN
jgi:hypothetical protein